MTIIEHELFDLGEGKGRLKCKIDCDAGCIWIAVEGYGDAASPDGYGFPIKVELYEKELHVVLFGDINKQDPTAVLSMQGAREFLRKAQGGAS